ncbi:MAG: hypothetical protein ACLR0U_29040 [Enterocloster clostridioformis]
MATSVCGAKSKSAEATATTSWTKGTSRREESVSPPEPVMTGIT